MPEADDEVQGWFDTLSSRLKKDLDATVKELAEELVEAQLDRLRSLQQPPEETGDLEESVIITKGKQDAQYIVTAGGVKTTNDSYDYALAFEFGTQKQPARSFFWSTYRERAQRMRERMEREILEKGGSL